LGSKFFGLYSEFLPPTLFIKIVNLMQGKKMIDKPNTAVKKSAEPDKVHKIKYIRNYKMNLVKRAWGKDL
jgi:hypothetical protein